MQAMSGEYFFYTLWLLAHTVVALILQARDIYSLVYHRIRGVFAFAQRSRSNTNEFFTTELSSICSKLPQHVTVLLPPTPTDNQLDVLVNLTLWSLAAKITHLSFYDPLGLLAKKEEDLIYQIQSKLAPNQWLIWHGHSSIGKNGIQGPKINVKIHTQGRQALVDTCRQLAHTTDQLTIPIISQHQLKSYEFPDPQLAIYFGEYLNLCGYPPWQVRLTEFLPGGCMQTFNEQHFVRVLKRYAKCEQRVGK